MLSARNVNVDEINEKVINLLDETTEGIYASVNTLEAVDKENIHEIIMTEYLNSLNPTCLPPHELENIQLLCLLEILILVKVCVMVLDY